MQGVHVFYAIGISFLIFSVLILQVAQIERYEASLQEQQKSLELDAKEIARLRASLVTARLDIQNITDDLKRLQLDNAGSSNYALRRPTMEELRVFLAQDNTDHNKYKDSGYVCINFAVDLKIAARQQHWNLSFVVVNFHDSSSESYGHALNGAYLADGTFVWIEPQYDIIYAGSIEKFLEYSFDVRGVVVEELAVVW